VKRKLKKHGNRLALVIEKSVLDLLGIDAGTLLSITTDGQCLIVVPAKKKVRPKRFQSAVAKGHRKYGKELKRLAD
jgi:antitoxin component of MazEF toxin-antitoxin module